VHRLAEQVEAVGGDVPVLVGQRDHVVDQNRCE
jgi:hypothetical protein